MVCSKVNALLSTEVAKQISTEVAKLISTEVDKLLSTEVAKLPNSKVLILILVLMPQQNDIQLLLPSLSIFILFI